MRGKTRWHVLHPGWKSLISILPEGELYYEPEAMTSFQAETPEGGNRSYR